MSSSAKDRKLSLVQASLHVLDSLDVDVLLLGISSENIPLKGLCGWCDWRLNGRLSRLLGDETFSCEKDETMLMDSNRRIKSLRLILFGMGESGFLDSKSFRQAVRRMLVVAKMAGFNKVAMEPPGLVTGSVPVAEAIRVSVEVVRKAHPKAWLTLVLPDEQDVVAAKKVAGSISDVQLVDFPKTEKH